MYELEDRWLNGLLSAEQEDKFHREQEELENSQDHVLARMQLALSPAEQTHFTCHLIERTLLKGSATTADGTSENRLIEDQWKCVKCAFVLNDDLRNVAMLKSVRQTAKWGFVPSTQTVEAFRSQFGDSVGMHVMKS